MAYIVLVGVLVGVILPIWSKWELVLPVQVYTRGHAKVEERQVVFGAFLMKKREQIFRMKRILHGPRMPCSNAGNTS
ncbi:MAG: hypothetical protein ACRCW2_13515 [Cellulosilyticaceae bacterium]